MANKELKLIKNLKRLFSNNVVIRHAGGKRLNLVDTDREQITTKRFSNIKGITRSGYYPSYNQYRYGVDSFAQRMAIFNDYEKMDAKDPILSSALDVISDEATVSDEQGDILKIISDDNDIKEILENLFFDILNIDYNLWSWVRNLIKYGDFFLFLDISPQYGIVNGRPISVYDIKKIEGEDEEDPNEVYFEIEGGRTRYENFQIAHFKNISDLNFAPYGRSYLEGARSIWKQLTLMEDAMLLSRIMRAPDKRTFYIEIGNMEGAEADQYIDSVINRMKKVPYIDESTGEYNLKFNLQNMLEDFYIPQRGGNRAAEIDSTGGLENAMIDDIEYLQKKLFAALRVPKAFLSYEESLESKATLAGLDLRFARTITRLQKIVISELNQIAMLHLYIHGFRNEKMVDFELELSNPSIVYDEEKINFWDEKISLAVSMKDSGLLSWDFIYKNVLKLSDDEADEEKKKVLKDKYTQWRLEQLESDGIENGPTPKPPEGDDDDSGGGSSKWGFNEFDGKNDDEDNRNKANEKGEAGENLSLRDMLGLTDYKKSTDMSKKNSDIRHNFNGGSALSLK